MHRIGLKEVIGIIFSIIVFSGMIFTSRVGINNLIAYQILCVSYLVAVFIELKFSILDKIVKLIKGKEETASRQS